MAEGMLLGLSSLKDLDLSGWSSLTALPASLTTLSSLQKLELRFCGDLAKLPDSLSSLNGLKWLGLDGCDKLSQAELSRAEDLVATANGGILKLPLSRIGNRIHLGL